MIAWRDTSQLWAHVKRLSQTKGQDELRLQAIGMKVLDE
ncbi:hypothetical protein HY2_06145 [Hyphomonas pacifica]|nr:hypothetical protein HY2_06145 [Hyphomonas pacifica]